MFSPPSRNFSREKGRRGDGWLQSFPDQSSQSILRKNTKINTNYYAMHIPETDTRHLFSIFTTIRHKKSRTWTSPYAFVCCLVLVLGFASRWPHTPIHNRRGREKTKLRFARPRSWPRYYVTVSSQQSEQEHRGLENPSAILKIRIIKLGWRSKIKETCVLWLCVLSV